MTGLTPAPDASVSSRRRRTIFVVTALGAFMASLDLSIVNVAFPALERAFSHDTRASLSWVITGYSIIFGSLLVVAGRTADRIGSRRVFFFGLGVFCLGSLLCGVAPSVVTLIIGRVIQGAGAAAVLPASLGLLLTSYSKEQRSQVVALWGGIGALAVATGPSLGALLITAFSWRAAFYVNLPVGLIAWLVGRRVLVKSSGTGSTSSPDSPGVALLSVSLGLLVLAISEGPSWGWSNARIIAGFVLAAFLFSTFLFRSSRHPEPVLDLRLFHARSFSVANTTALLYSMGFFAMLLGNILFLTSVWHYSVLRAGLAVTPGPLVVAVVSGTAGKMAGRYGFRRVLMVGFSVFTLGLLWYLWRVELTPHYFSLWLPGTVIVGLGIGLTFPVISAAAVSSLEPSRYSVGSAVNQTARQVGGALGVAILVVILGTPTTAAQALGNFRHLWAYTAILVAAAGLVAAFLGKPHPPVVASENGDLVVGEAVGLEEMLDGEMAVGAGDRENDATL
ncbi:MAG: drug resistance transporter, EmrB/QacA subfamily [Acidimicrobiaceae bacterium]|nr:drug resistance transporter, EmrB/QacA subfamily [Acidimicrobiaceae bacterium]